MRLWGRLEGLLVLVLLAPCVAAGEGPAREKAFVARGFSRRTIYHSPQTPGYTSWVGAWEMPDKSLMVCFTQATGPAKSRPPVPKDLREKLGIPADYDFL